MVKFFSRFACGVAMSFLLYGNAAAAPAEPELRIGILSDAQCPKSKDSWGLKNARRGFELLRQRGVDVVVLGGDGTLNAVLNGMLHRALRTPIT